MCDECDGNIGVESIVNFRGLDQFQGVLSVEHRIDALYDIKIRREIAAFGKNYATVLHVWHCQRARKQFKNIHGCGIGDDDLGFVSTKQP